MVLFIKRVAARWCILLAATSDAEAFLFLPECTLLMTADPLQLLFNAHPGTTTLDTAQLLFHRTTWTLLLTNDGRYEEKTPQSNTETQKTQRVNVNINLISLCHSSRNDSENNVMFSTVKT